MEHADPQQFWEQLYGAQERVWSGRVNAVLAQVAEGLAPGRALDLGCGEGADALWLAERGWQVTAVDISQIAVQRAAAEAARRRLVVDWVCADLAQRLPRGPYDLVAASFLQSPVVLPRIEVLRRAAAEVAPGGILLVVGHAAPPPWSEHQPDPSLMPAPAEVVAQLDLPQPAWEAVRVEEVTRAAVGPHGHSAELVDSVVLLQKRGADVG